MSVKAVAYRQIMHMVQQKEHLLVDWVLYPLTMVVSFGLLVSTLTPDPEAVVYVLSAAILWRVAATFQTSVVIGFMEDVWHETMRQTWAMPLRLRDYVLGNSALGLVSSLFTLCVTLVFAWALFGVVVSDWGLFLGTYAMLCVFGAAVGIMGMVALLLVGEGAQPANWVIMDMMVLASGVFYPLSVLPVPVRFVAHFLPTMYAFLAIRQGDAMLLAIGALMSLCYLVVAWYALKHALRRAKAQGKLVKFH